MNRIVVAILLLGFSLVCVVPVLAGPQGLFLYPEKGQTKELQAKDEAACEDWAGEETRFDPDVPPQAGSSSSHGGEVVRGGMRGAAAGALIGAIGGDAGKGAAIGAGVGGAAGIGRRRATSDYERQASANAQAQYDSGLDKYKRALSACLEARGYTVK